MDSTSPEQLKSDVILSRPEVSAYLSLRHNSRQKLFHYTSAQGLLGIVTNRELWATDVRYLNDAREFVHGLDQARAVVRGITTTGVETDLVRALESSISFPQGAPFAVFSLSEKGDLLSQWRGYCPPAGGYSLGFDTVKLSRAVSKYVFGLFSCLYEEALQRRVLEGRVWQQLEWFVRQQGTPRGAVEDHRERLWYFILRCAALFKDQSFSEESEWRLIGIPAHNAIPWKFRPGARMLIPFVALDLPSEADQHPLTEIIIGPNPQPELAAVSVRGLLDDHNLKHVSIAHSAIPYRAL